MSYDINLTAHIIDPANAYDVARSDVDMNGDDWQEAADFVFDQFEHLEIGYSGVATENGVMIDMACVALDMALTWGQITNDLIDEAARRAAEVDLPF